MQIIPQRFPAGRISALFINHPQPPEHTNSGSAMRDNKKQRASEGDSGSSGGSDGQHLLTATFFTALYRILTDKGTITIVTDNLAYARLLANLLASMSTMAINRNKVCYTHYNTLYTLYHTIPHYTHYNTLYHIITHYTHYTTLYHTIPYYNTLYHTIPHYTTLYHTIPHYTTL